MRTDTHALRRAVLIISFAPLLFKAITYLRIDAYTPLIVLLGFGAMVSWGMASDLRNEARAARIWAVAILMWAVARLGLMALFLFTSVSEAHVESQFTLGYTAWSAGHLLAGAFLIRTYREAPIIKVL